MSTRDKGLGAWSYTPIPPYVSMAWSLIKNTDNFTFNFYSSTLPGYIAYAVDKASFYEGELEERATQKCSAQNVLHIFAPLIANVPLCLQGSGGERQHICWP
jgi:hypothetical protein